MFKWFSRRSGGAAPDAMAVFLGNPGKKYELTRHNAGFLAGDLMARRLGAGFDKLKFQAVYALADAAPGRLLLLKPQTFMNKSGQSVRDAAAFYKIPAARIVVVYDDVSLPPGRLRVRGKGSDGGHNGIKDIIYHMQSDAFPRVKIGVGAPPHPDWDMADWVLSTFKEQELRELTPVLERAGEAVESILRDGVYEAMNRYNGGQK